MGTIYSIACTDCKVTRDLDKFRTLDVVGDRDDALKLSTNLEEKECLYREGLLISFMIEHIGHKCVFFNEKIAEEEKMNPDNDNEFKSDLNLW